MLKVESKSVYLLFCASMGSNTTANVLKLAIDRHARSGKGNGSEDRLLMRFLASCYASLR